MISENIQDLITMGKAMPNSLHRNKIVSHLEDARAHAVALEILDGSRKFEDPIIKPNSQTVSCTCPHYPEAMDTGCPIHGTK